MVPMNVFAAETIDESVDLNDVEVVESGACGENAFWILDNNGTLTISGQGKMADYDFEMPWYFKRSDIKNVVIEDGIESISSEAFIDCKSITTISIPESVVYIGESAFEDCLSLQYVTMPSGITEINPRTFFSCVDLKEINIPNGVTRIGEYAFHMCTSLEIIELPDCVDIIEEGAFWNCYGLDGITIPEKVTRIEYGTFRNCGFITLNIPENVTYIGEIAFYACNKLESVSLPNGLREIDERAFDDCSKLREIIIPNSVETVGEHAFWRCKKLKNVILPNSLTKIKYGTFRGCTNLESISIPHTISEIGTYSFAECNNLNKIIIPFSISEIEKDAFDECENLVIYCFEDSFAEKYATENNIEYTYFECEEHIYTGWEIIRNSTCADKGSKSRKCLYCGFVETEEIELIQHLFSVDWTVDKEATCTEEGSKSHHCTRCEAKEDVTVIPTLSHSYKSVLTKATTNSNGGSKQVCSVCGNVKSSMIIYKISSVSLSSTAYTYNGEKKTPSVTVKDSEGNKLVKNEDYTVTYSSSTRKLIGKYRVTVTFTGNYSGSKVLYFEIGPKNPSSVKTALYGYDDVKVSWSKVSGASGYKVYYKKSTASSWTLLKTTTSTSCKKANLSDGVKYDFKVVAYKNVSGNACENAGKTSSIYTLKKVTGVKAAKSSSKVKVSWANISGETGYQISQSTRKSKTKIVATYKTTSGKSKTIKATKGKTYYYKVRAYKIVSGKKIYGPWSSVIKYKR